jgi:hypothetical protein
LYQEKISMDIRKYEQLMDLVINENEETARELFHELVVEKSREIFESIMAEDEDMMDDEMMEGDYGDTMEDDGMGGQVGDLLDEINAEEAGVMEEEDEELDFTDDEEDIEIGGDDDDFGDDDGEEDEEAIIRIEDKLDQLMAEFESIMGGDDMGGDDMADDDMDMGDDDMDFGDEDEAMMEAVELKKVSVTHGDNGAQTKSPGLQGSGQAGMDSHPVKFSGAHEAVPTAPKGPSNFYSKGETQVKGAGNFKNSPGKDNFKDKGEAAPKPKHGDDGANTKSPVAESRRSARRPIR